MKFEKYESLTNSYNTKTLIEFKERVPSDLGWVITEKIHGANYQFRSQRPVVGKDWSVRVGKRTGFTDENFFKVNSSEKFLATKTLIENAMRNMYDTDPGIRDIEICGELYGPGIQKGVFYSRSKRFAAFDIKINNVFVEHPTYMEYIKKYSIPHTPVLFIGTLDLCLGQSNTFNSKIPELLGEEAPEGDNICEGIVIKPMKTYHLNSGARVALKNKNDLWCEKASIKKISLNNPLKGNDLKIYTLLSGMVDEKRIESAISKIGSEMKYIPLLLEEVNNDILLSTNEPEYEKYLKDITVDISKENTNKIRRTISKRIVTLIKESIQRRVP